MSSIGIIYGSNTGETEEIAEMIGEKMDLADHVHDISNVDNDTILEYDVLLLGIPTWDIGESEPNWLFAMDGDLSDIDFTGKTIALFGLGDAHGYADTFLDAIAILKEFCQAHGATSFIGRWPAEGYEFDNSRALDDDGFFQGLGLDNDTEPEKTEERVDQWIEQVKGEIAALA